MFKNLGSLELFQKLQPRFREITWHLDQNSDEFIKEIFQKEKIRLIPGYFGYKDAIEVNCFDEEGHVHSLWWAEIKKDEPCYPSFSVREGELRLRFIFDPS